MAESTTTEAPRTWWDELDAVVFINMDTRTDRLQLFMERVGRYVPAEKLHRLSATVGKELPGFGEAPWFTEKTGDRAAAWAGAAGCALSHRRAVELVAQKGWRKALILEDDVIYEATAAEEALLQESAAALQGAAMLYPGYNRPVPHGRCVRRNEGAGVWQVEGVLAAHSYIITAEVAALLLPRMATEQNVWEWISIYRAVDTFYQEYAALLPGCRVFALFPVVFHQGTSASNIMGGVVAGEDYACPRAPYDYLSLRGIGHLLLRPFHLLKVRLNAVRTHRRALRSGLPGFRKRRRKTA